MKKSFSAGLILLLPLLISGWILTYLFNLIRSPIYHFLTSFHHVSIQLTPAAFTSHSTLMLCLSYLLALFVTLTALCALGFTGRRVVVYSITHFINQLIFKIPFLGTLYRLSREVVKAVLSPAQKPFQEAALLPFFSPQTLSVGIVMGHIPPFISALPPSIDTVALILTAPHPGSGYLIFGSKQSFTHLKSSTEDVMKFLISCGTTPLS
ncbi:MAG: DUF502 domain-containing protein [Candidatus Rhabdochlamydia sp.]